MHPQKYEVINRIRAALKKKTGQCWSVSWGRGTGGGWLTVQAPPKRRVAHDPNPAYDWRNPTNPPTPASLERQPKPGEIGYYTSLADCKLIASAFGLDRPVHFQGLTISPDERGWYLQKVEAGL